MKQIKILMVDENEIMRFYFRDSFWLHSERDEYELSFASNLTQAQQILQQPETIFDIIFIDLVLHIEHKNRTVLDPEAGLGLITQIRSEPKFKDTKVVVFSSKQYFHLWKKAKKLGANFFLKSDEYLPRFLVKWVEKIFKEKSARWTI